MVVCLNDWPCAGLVHAPWVAHKVNTPCAGGKVAHKVKQLCAVGRVAHKVTHKDAQGAHKVAHKVRELVGAQGRMNLVQGPGCAQGYFYLVPGRAAHKVAQGLQNECLGRKALANHHIGKHNLFFTA